MNDEILSKPVVLLCQASRLGYGKVAGIEIASIFERWLAVTHPAIGSELISAKRIITTIRRASNYSSDRLDAGAAALLKSDRTRVI